MRTLVVAAMLALVAVACSTTGKGNLTGNDAGACACQLLSNDTSTVYDDVLVIPWDCYCGQNPGGCQSVWPPSRAGGDTRVDYPDCGLTVLTVRTVGGPSITVFDADENLVGFEYGGDVADYKCPSEPSLHAFRERSGQFPGAICRAVECGVNYTGPFPCPPTLGADAGSGDAL